MTDAHPSKERTLVLIKPDGVQRSLIGEIIKRYEDVGLKLVGMKMLVPTEAHIVQQPRQLLLDQAIQCWN